MADQADRDAHAHTSPAAAVLYRRLLALHTHDEPTLDDAIRLIVEVTGAQFAIIELFDAGGQPRYWRGHGRTLELDELRRAISRGIVRHAIDSNETVLTSSALSDDRFRDLESVQQRDIQAVLCSPIGAGLGVVYLQGRAEPGSFTEQDCDLVELTADQLARVDTRFVERPATTFREKARASQRRHMLEALERNDWNKISTAHELGITRQGLYKLLRQLGIELR